MSLLFYRIGTIPNGCGNDRLSINRPQHHAGQQGTTTLKDMSDFSEAILLTGGYPGEPVRLRFGPSEC